MGKIFKKTTLGRDYNNMKKTLRIGATGVAIVAAMGMSSVAHADNADATATAEILEALTLDVATGTSLDFGAMVVSADPGVDSVVSLAADGTLDCDDTNVVCSGTTGVPTFNVGGTASKAVTISLPTADVDLTHTNGVNTVVLGGFVTDAADNAAGDPEVTLDGDGNGSFNVGGDITIESDDPAGIYTGSFNVSVEYS